MSKVDDNIARILNEGFEQRRKVHKADAKVDSSKYVSIKQAANMINRSAMRVRRMIKEGKLECIRVDRKIFIVVICIDHNFVIEARFFQVDLIN